MLHILSTAVLALIVIGLFMRNRRPALHWRIMITAFVCDVLLVLYIEISRHAVEVVVASTTPIIWFHATISLAVLAAYLVMFWLGRSVLQGHIVRRRTHLQVGVAFCVLRSLNYVTSFIV